jgi:CubicO group peptidase (beta-lactamase class C family)
LSRLLATSGILLLFSIPCIAQPGIPANFDRFIKTEMQRQRIPGLSIAVIKDGRAILIRGYGFSNVEHQIPVKPETVFQSGSIAKQFTAAAVMILVEDGKLSLDDQVSKYFTDAPASWKSITVRHLLTHTSGLGDYPPDLDLRRDYTEEEYLAIIKAVPLAFPTGTKWDYSNLNYVTLGILIHKITGKFYGDFLAERVFKPLNMSTARVISEADIVANRAAGYRLVDGQLKNQEWVSPSTNTTADGSLYFTILDLAKWDAALYTDKPLKQSSLAQIWSPTKLDNGTKKAYGFGWHTDKMHGRRIVFHGGAWQGFKSFIVRFPDDKLTLIFFANLWETKDFKLARGLIANFFPEFALPSVQAIEDKEPQVTALLRKVLLQFTRSAADPTLFTPEARTKLFHDGQDKQIVESLNSLSLPVALIYTNELIEHREEGGLRIYRYMLNDLGTTLFCTAKLTRDDEIAGLEVSSE